MLADEQEKYDQIITYYYDHRFDYVPGIADNSNVELGITFFGSRKDGSPVTLNPLYGKDVAMGGLTFSEAVNSPGEFEMGTIATKRLTLSLDNFDSRFDAYDFVGYQVAIVVNYKVGGRWQAIRYFQGVITEATETYANVIELVATDQLYELDQPVDLSALKSKSTVEGYVESLLPTILGGSSLFAWKQDVPFAEQRITTFPEDITADTTRKEVFQWLAQLGGCFVHSPDHPGIAFEWYDKEAFEPDIQTVDGITSTLSKEEWVDGAVFNDSGDDVDGGGFDWGLTLETNNTRYDSLGFDTYNYHVVNSLFSSSISKETIEVNSVDFFIEDPADSSGKRRHRFSPVGGGMGTGAKPDFSKPYYQNRYYLRVKGNAFLNTSPHPVWYEDEIRNRVLGTKFVPFDIKCVADPRIRLADPIVIVGNNGRIFKSYVTGYEYSTSGTMRVYCEADSRLQNLNDTYVEVNDWVKGN